MRETVKFGLAVVVMVVIGFSAGWLGVKCQSEYLGYLAFQEGTERFRTGIVAAVNAQAGRVQQNERLIGQLAELAGATVVQRPVPSALPVPQPVEEPEQPEPEEVSETMD